MRFLLFVGSFILITSTHHVSAQSVTLWQVSGGHLLSASVTAPLQPLGTAANGLSTTYLYQALGPFTTLESSNGLTSEVSALTATGTRTIVASASGWIELFLGPSGTPTGVLGCTLITSGIGNCFNGPPNAIVAEPTGKPFAEVLSVATPVPTSTDTPSQSIAPATSSTTAQPEQTSAPFDQGNSSKKSSSAGAIAGGVIGGLAGVLIVALGIALLWRRQLRRRMFFEDEGDTSQRRSEFVAHSTAATAAAEDNYPSPTTIIPNSKEAMARYGRRSGGFHVTNQSMDSRTSVGERSDSYTHTSTTTPITRSLAEISDRLRRLEMAGNAQSEPPPTYYAE
ncbi:hypothetical protein GYMLUDRAFT_265868 [Collybiopsis luxurians FD-317 M1]|uniref:Mid2 domain-containing protein n=1 Tax=Collybiopsis luxurians FD-317 M1 TaxID=944289 RepID=A0A0D0C0Z7_9AGAR|nr:hypothetical protein GYMLUDRAFT_265868 [Collybiopsis luxurians FD-317 M1]